MTRTYRNLALAFLAVICISAGALLWAGRGQAMRNPAPAPVAAAPSRLADGAGVSAAYSAAAEETRRCLEEAGLKSVTTSADAAGKVSFSWGGFPTREEAQRAGEIYKGCYFKLMADADRLWQQSPETETAAAERGWIVMKCIEEGRPGFRFAGDEQAVVAQVIGMQRGGDPVAQRCLAAAGTDLVKFTPLAH
ncbi:MAG: hypothetical protein HY875_14925 [Chloroflexi bacterium]|nr:hypothetical protein [Chloroflexota bacterium]